MTLPLEGVRVADFSWVVAGPFCTEFLALMGAEVIRVESAMHTDINRRLPPWVDGVTPSGVEGSGLWHGLNLNKKSITLNLMNAEAQQLALDLVRRSDIVIENFAFGQMEKFNLGYERLRSERPDLIMVSSSGLGRWGPYRTYVTYGPPLTAYTGLASVTGQDGGLPERWVGGLWSDHQAGLTSLFGVLLALEYRERTGEGQLVEYSMADTIAAQLPEAFIEYGVTAVPPGPIGNREPGMCPHGVYRATGDDRWLAIAVQSDADWLLLRSVMPGPAWWYDPILEGVVARLVREDEIDEVVSSWTRGRDAQEAATQLQAAGISAGAVARVPDLLEDRVLQERFFFLQQRHPEVGRRILAGIGWEMGTLAPLAPRHAPLLGEHNWEQFVEQRGLSPERFAALVDTRAIV